MHPIVPFMDVLGAPALGVTACGIWFGGVVPQGGLTVLRGMIDIGSVSVAVVLDFSPCWLVVIGCVVVTVHWATDCITDVA